MNVRNHVWVLNGVIQDVLKRREAESIDVQILDIKQCFDALWPEECLSDLYQLCSPLYIDGWKETDVTSVETGITQNRDVYEGKTF